MTRAQTSRVWPLLLVTTASLGCVWAYSGCTDASATHNEADATSPDFDGPPSSGDALSPAQNYGAPPECTARLVPTSDCKHPAVVQSCEKGYCTIPPGCFVMGSPECQPYRGAYSEPEAQVTLTHKFEIGQHEVTQGEWVAAGFPNRAKPPAPDAGVTYGSCMDASCPATQFSWFDGLQYANHASRIHQPPLPECYVLTDCVATAEGTHCVGARAVPENLYECRGYRLPTEAEWEYAARASTRTPYYSGRIFATAFDPRAECHAMPEANLDKVAWYCATATALSPYFIQTRPIMLKAPNAWGLYDMLGNVAEWTSDQYDGLGFRKGPYVDPGDRLGTSNTRTKRGGGASSAALTTTASNRLGADWNGLDAQGLRLVRTVD